MAVEQVGKLTQALRETQAERDSEKRVSEECSRKLAAAETSCAALRADLAKFNAPLLEGATRFALLETE